MNEAPKVESSTGSETTEAWALSASIGELFAACVTTTVRRDKSTAKAVEDFISHLKIIRDSRHYHELVIISPDLPANSRLSYEAKRSAASIAERRLKWTISASLSCRINSAWGNSVLGNASARRESAA